MEIIKIKFYVDTDAVILWCWDAGMLMHVCNITYIYIQDVYG